MQARYYDPVIGRFYSNDPVDVLNHLEKENGFQGFNRYAYVINNPYKYTDPNGEAWSWVSAGVGGAAGFLGGAVASIVEQAFGEEDISWGKVAGNATAGFAGGFLADGIVGAATGDPTALGAALTITTAAAGGVVTGEINAATNTLVETDLSQPQFQGRYRIEDIGASQSTESSQNSESSTDTNLSPTLTRGNLVGRMAEKTGVIEKIGGQ